jgi:hypothetical protein
MVIAALHLRLEEISKKGSARLIGPRRCSNVISIRTSRARVVTIY